MRPGSQFNDTRYFIKSRGATTTSGEQALQRIKFYVKVRKEHFNFKKDSTRIGPRDVAYHYLIVLQAVGCTIFIAELTHIIAMWGNSIKHLFMP
jgi:hypothetical protein